MNILTDKLKLISFKESELFYKVVAEGLVKAKSSLIIGTYNLQDIRIQIRNFTGSLSEILQNLARRNVKILICLAPFMQKSQFIQTLRGSPFPTDNIIIRFCRRMHFKTIIVDLNYAYIGTANLSGAGVGLKSVRKRNFELGFVTQDTDIIADITWTFMEIFSGKFCSNEKCHFYKNSHFKEQCEGILRNRI